MKITNSKFSKVFFCLVLGLSVIALSLGLNIKSKSSKTLC